MLACVAYAAVPTGIAELFRSGQAGDTPQFILFDLDGVPDLADVLKHGRIRSVILQRPGADPAMMAEMAGGALFGQSCLMATHPMEIRPPLNWPRPGVTGSAVQLFVQ